LSEGGVVLIFVRAPRIGRVKTRLAADVGAEAALLVYRSLAEQVVRQARRLRGARIRVHYTPAGAEAEIRAWLGADLEYVVQAEGDLGTRLTAAFNQAFQEGFERVVVVGSDVAELRAEHLERAIGSIAEDTVVVGPAADGGYWLLGLASPAPGLFAGIDWSTEHVLGQTLDRAAEASLAVVRLDTLTDVDRADDLPDDWRHLIEKSETGG
jgi:uncharacterized protein